MSYNMTDVNYIETRIYNGPFQAYFNSALDMSPAGCPYRGTTLCHRCPLSPPVECGYRCQSRAALIDCNERYRCKCGQDQTPTLRAMGLVE